MRATEPKPAAQRPQSGSGDAPPLRAAQEIEAFAGDPNFMTSLARGLAVVRGFSQEPRRLSIAQLSQKTGIPRAAVRRVLYTLTRLAYVGSEDGRHYALLMFPENVSMAATSPRRLGSLDRAGYRFRGLQRQLRPVAGGRRGGTRRKRRAGPAECVRCRSPESRRAASAGRAGQSPPTRRTVREIKTAPGWESAVDMLLS